MRIRDSGLLVTLTAFLVAGCGSGGAGSGSVVSASGLDSSSDAAAEVTLPDAGPRRADSGVEDLGQDPAEDPLTSEDSSTELSDAGPELGEALDWALGEPGPFGVGYRVYELSYRRPDIDELRRVSVNVWYPSLETEGAPAAYLGTFLDAEVMTDAAPADSAYAEGYPVHVHSHGFQGFGGTSAFLMRHYASHGWLAVAPDHVDNTLLDHRDPLPTAHYFLKVLDVRASLDLLEALPDDDILAGRADTRRVVMSGHSFGTYACWAAGGASYDLDVIRQRCAEGALPSGSCTESELAVFESDTLADPRIVATIPMAGTIRSSWFGAEGHRAVIAPVLSFTGSNDNPGQGLEQWERIGAELELSWVEIEGGCHQSFALGGCPTLGNAEGFAIVNTYALAFGRAHVLGDDGLGTRSVLSGEREVSPRVRLETPSP